MVLGVKAQRVERIGNATLYLGDAREVVPSVPVVNAVVTDPPYGVSYVTNYRKTMATPEMLHGDEAPPLWIIPMLAERCLEGGAVYICTSLAVLDVWRVAVQAAGLAIKTPIIWDKGNTTAGDLDGDFGNQVEVVIFAHRGRHRLRSGRLSNLWRIPRPPAGDHPTPKPVGLMARMIESSTDCGGAVLDPFMGSGTTGVAAARLGRRFIGVEIEQRYFDIACRRIEAEVRSPRLPLIAPEPALQEAML